MKRILFIAGCLVSLSFCGKAQTKYDEAEFKTKPVWIQMMDDSTVNYYQAVKAFNIYWEDRFRPVEKDEEEENEKMSRKERRDQRRHEKKLASMTAAERNEFDQLNYRYKLFTNWMQEMKPYVQPDGSILTRWQRIHNWYEQQEKIRSQKTN